MMWLEWSPEKWLSLCKWSVNADDCLKSSLQTVHKTKVFNWKSRMDNALKLEDTIDAKVCGPEIKVPVAVHKDLLSHSMYIYVEFQNWTSMPMQLSVNYM